MGIYKRKLTKGLRHYYRGQYLGIKYHSQAIYHTKQEAKRAEAIRINEIEEQKKNPVNDMYLVEFLNKRLDYIKIKLSEKYYKENHRYFKKLVAFAGDIPTSQVTKKMINELLMKEAKRFQKEGKDNFKVNDMIRCLKAAFNYGKRELELSINNPCEGLKMWSVNINLKYIPTDGEIKKVRKILNDKQKKLFDFVDETACRINEALRLTGNDIDGDLITLFSRKSKNSNLTPRRIPKPECLNGDILNGKVFDEWTAYPRFLEEAVKKSKLTQWNWHNLRHRRASIWAKNGMNTFEIMMRLGHTNLATTMRYLQLLGYTMT
jgi:integrase